MQHEREDIFEQYEAAVRAFKESIERSKGLRGLQFYEAMLETDRLYDLALRLEEALAQYDEAVR